jgi:hypothetical protein
MIKYGGLLKIIGLMVLAVLLIGGALALTGTGKPAVLSGDALKATLGSAQTGSAAQTSSKDWGAILSGIKANSATSQDRAASGTAISDSQMKAALRALGKSSSEQPASGNFSKDSSSSLGPGAAMAGKAFEQMGQNKLAARASNDP